MEKSCYPDIVHKYLLAWWQHEYCTGDCQAAHDKKPLKVCTCTPLVWLRGIRNPVNTWCDHHLPHAAQQINFVIRFLILPVECWSIPLQWLCKFACLCQKLKRAVVHADVAHHARTGRFHASRTCVQILAQAKQKRTPVQSASFVSIWLLKLVATLINLTSMPLSFFEIAIQ